MLILGLQGSPRKKGNTNFLLTTFLQAAEQRGAATRIISVAESNILPCKEYVVCEKKGTCPIDDDMAGEIYGLLRQAEVVVLASPIFFYNMTCQLKALVDRCQVFWARKYRLKLSDPLKATRRGYLLSVAATRGKTLFDGLQLTTKYFFDAIDARFDGSLVYRGIEGPKDMANHPTVGEDVDQAVDALMARYTSRKKVAVPVPPRMPAAVRWPAPGPSAWPATGSMCPPAEASPPNRSIRHGGKVMAEQRVDMAFRTPQNIDAALANGGPDAVVTLGCGEHVR